MRAIVGIHSYRGRVLHLSAFPKKPSWNIAASMWVMALDIRCAVVNNVRLQVACASISSNNHFETNLERLGLLERRKCREFQASCIDRKTSLASKQFPFSPSLPSASRNTVAGRMPSERQTFECLCCASSDALSSSQPSSIAPFVAASTFCSLNDNSNFCLCMHVREHECIHACIYACVHALCMHDVSTCMCMYVRMQLCSMYVQNTPTRA